MAALRSGNPHLAIELWANVFHQELRANLARLHHEFDPNYVISSTWSTYLSREEIQEVLISGGLGFVAASLHSNWRSATEVGSYRVTDIAAWLPEPRRYSDRRERGVTTLSSRPVARPCSSATAVRASRPCAVARCVWSAKPMPTAARTTVRRAATAAAPREFRKLQNAFMN